MTAHESTSDRVNEAIPLLPTTSRPPSKSNASDASGATQPHALMGIACVAISAVCFSLMSTFLKYATFTMTSMEAIFWRSAGAFVLNYACIRYQGISTYVIPEDRMMLLYRCIAGFSSISFAFYAVSQMVLADASVLVFTSPVITFFFGFCLLGEHVDVPSFVCALVSFAGLVCVVRPGFLFGYEEGAASTGSWLAICSAFLGAIGQAFVFITVRKLRGINMHVVVHYFMLFSIMGSVLYMAFVQRRFVAPDTATLWLALLGTGVFTFMGQLFLTKGFQLEKAGIASVMRYLDVVCVFIWDAVLLGERINHWSVVGALIICTCASIIALRKAKVLDRATLEHPFGSRARVMSSSAPMAETAPLLLPVTQLNADKRPSQPHALMGMALVALSSVCFSVMSTMVKYETYSMSSMEAVFWRSSISGCINYGVIRYTGQSVFIKSEDHLMVFVRCVVGFTSIAFAFYAMSQMVLADASVLVFMSPVITFFLGACMLGEAIDSMGLLCALASFVGLICVVRPEFLFGYSESEAVGSWDAYAAGLLGAVFQALVFISVRKLKHIHFLVILHYFMIFSSSVAFIYIAIFQRHFVIPSTISLWLAVIGTGVFTFMGLSFLTKGFQLEKAGVASVMRYLDVVCVFVWDQVFLGEQISGWSVVGASIICVSASLIALRKAQKI